MGRLALIAVMFGIVALARPAMAVESRIALVIGNSSYSDEPLANPANDARLIAEVLRNLGFDVIERIDSDREAIHLAAFELQDRLFDTGNDAIGLFFYAGHVVRLRRKPTVLRSRKRRIAWLKPNVSKRTIPLSKSEDHVYHLFDATLLEKSGRVYASLPAVKSGATCISWVNAGDQALIHYVGLAYASPTLDLAKLVALRTCRKKVAKTPEDCQCVMVHENDVRVLRDSVGN